MFIIAAVATVLVGATRALFTDTVENESNVFASGTLSIDMLDENLEPISSPIFTCQNWKPTDTVTRFINVKNTGSLECDAFWQTALTSEQCGLGGEHLGEVLFADLKADTNNDNVYETDVFQGRMSELTNVVSLGNIAPGASKKLSFKVTFDSMAGNGYQGLESTYKLSAVANQVL